MTSCRGLRHWLGGVLSDDKEVAKGTRRVFDLSINAVYVTWLLKVAALTWKVISAADKRLLNQGVVFLTRR